MQPDLAPLLQQRQFTVGPCLVTGHQQRTGRDSGSVSGQGHDQPMGGQPIGPSTAHFFGQIGHGHPAGQPIANRLVLEQSFEPIDIGRVVVGLHHARQGLHAAVRPPQGGLPVGRKAVRAIDQHEGQLVSRRGHAGAPAHFEQAEQGLRRGSLSFSHGEELLPVVAVVRPGSRWWRRAVFR